MNYEIINSKSINGMFVNSTYESVDIKVKGYWNDCITLSFDRERAKFNARISVKSGGRDTKEVKEDAQAVLYLAEALVFASKYAENILAEQEILEGNYQHYLNTLRK